jgi:type II secretory pathway pseudopilin PulG
MFKLSWRRRFRPEHGYSLVDLLATTAVIATVGAIAVPQISKSLDNQRLGVDVRNVERELQSARLDAVKANQPIRIRFNCPSVGMYRRVELLGTINSPAANDADSAAVTRCGTAYPYPAPDQDPLTRPNNDGPIQRLNPKVSFLSVQTIEFRPNGTAFVVNGNTWSQIPNYITLSMNKGSSVKMIQVNGLGKIQLQ